LFLEELGEGLIAHLLDFHSKTSKFLYKDIQDAFRSGATGGRLGEGTFLLLFCIYSKNYTECQKQAADFRNKTGIEVKKDDCANF